MSTPILGITPVFDANRGWRVWNISEIYTGLTGSTGRYVPNVNDMVIDYTRGFFVVSEVDHTSGLSVMQKWELPKDPDAVTDEDILLGAGPGVISESYRLYVDTSVMPHTMTFERRLRVYGSTVTKVKVYLGTDISASGKVISSMYDSGGTFIGENVPLELALVPDSDNRAIKVPVVAYTTHPLVDGEVVTAVFYSDDGGVCSIAKLLVKETRWIHSTDAATKFVETIHLESPFLSGGDSRVIEYPVNLPIDSAAMIGVVTYSNGEIVRLPIDGTRFRIHGLDNFVSSIVGQKIPIVLSYYLSSGESTNSGTGGVSGVHISENYSVAAVKADGAYSVKLFGYPHWIDAINGYRMEYWLYNLDRDERYYATPHVVAGANARAFNPLEYGVVQDIVVSVNLSKVSARFSAYHHVQPLRVTLLGPGSDNRSVIGGNWLIGFEPGQATPYGSAVWAAIQMINANNYKVRVGSDAGSKEQWLRKMFYDSKPLYNIGTETQAVEPSHFNLVIGNTTIEYGIEQWNDLLVVPGHVSQGELTYLEFFKRTATNDLLLGISGLITHHVSNL